MAIQIPEKNYYLAGGKLYFQPKGDTEFTKLGGVVNTKASFSAEYVDVMDHSGKQEVLAKRLAKSFSGTLKFETTDWSEKALEVTLMATKTTPVVSDIEAGWANKQVVAFDIGQQTIIEGTFKFVSENTHGQPIVLIVYNASVKPSSDTSLQAKEISNLTFEGAVMLDQATNKYATMYVEAVDVP